MVDRFTKSVLSLIAASLFWIAFGSYILPSASAQFGGSTVRIDGVQAHSGMIPVVIRAIDRGATGRWDPVKVSRVD